MLGGEYVRSNRDTLKDQIDFFCIPDIESEVEIESPLFARTVFHSAAVGLNCPANKVTGTRLAILQSKFKTVIVYGKISHCIIMNSSTTGTVTRAATSIQPTMTDAQCAHLSKVLPQDGDLFSPYVINCVIMSVLSVTAVIGNVLILVSLCRAPQFLRQPSYFLLVNLAFADLCVGFVAEPLYLMYKISYLLNPLSILSCYAGVVFNFFSYLLTSLSLWTAAAISLDRLLALLLHMKYSAVVTRWRVVILIAVLLALSFVFASMFEWALDAQNSVFVCANSLALLIALLSYVRIFQIVCYHQRQISSHQLGEISVTDRGETDSVGTSFHGQEVREQLKGVATETREKSATFDNKQVNETTEEAKITEHKRTHHQQLQEKETSGSFENHGCTTTSEGLDVQQLDEQIKIALSNDRRKSQEQPECLENVSIKDNTSQREKTTQKNQHHFESPGVTNTAALIEISVLEKLDLGVELTIKALEVEGGSQKSLRAGEGNKNFLLGEGNSESRQENRDNNSEFEMIDMQPLKVPCDDHNKLKSEELQGGNCTLGEKQNKTKNENQNNVITEEKPPASSQETQELKDKATAKPAITVNLHESSVNNEMTNANQIINRTRKRFRMRHFKKSFYNMFVIWFLMLLCYLPLICTSILFLLIGRSHSMHLAFNFTTSVMFLNSSINPIVFCWRIREFRAAVKKTLKEVFGIWSNQRG